MSPAIMAILIGIFVFICVGGSCTGYLVGLKLKQQANQGKLASSATAVNAGDIVKAIHAYADQHRGKLPDTYSIDQQGKPLLSWRVHLLPYMDQQDLYSRLNLNEPWDSPHNKQFWSQMPELYKNPDLEVEDGETGFVLITGADTAFRPGRPRTLGEITDGLTQTIGVAATAQVRNWMQPTDLDFSKLNLTIGGEAPSIGSRESGGAVVAFMDASFATLPMDTKPEVLKALITCNGGENVQ